MAGETAAEAEAAEVRASARACDFDRYLAALLSPAGKRDDLFALAATLGEIARIPALVKEPMMGEVRLTWWRDELTKPADAEPSGHPVADAMRRVIARHALPKELLEGLCAARVFDLYADPVREPAEFDAYLDATEGAGFRLASGILGAGTAADATMLAAGRAFGITRVLAELPRLQKRGRDPLPALPNVFDMRDKTKFYIDRARSELRAVRAAYPSLSRERKAALLPLALVEPYLRALEKPGHDAFAEPADIRPLTRVWRLWRAHVTGRV